MHMSHFATFSQNGNKSHHQLLFKKGDLGLYLPSNYARRSIDTLFPNGFTQHWTLLGISFPPYFSTTLLLLSFSRRRNFMPNYLGNSRTANVIFFPWQSFPEKKSGRTLKNQMRLFWLVFKHCISRVAPNTWQQTKVIQTTACTIFWGFSKQKFKENFPLNNTP